MAGIFETPRGAGTLFLGGERLQGSAVREQCVHATTAVANIMRSSLGPSGLDKASLSSKLETCWTNLQ